MGRPITITVPDDLYSTLLNISSRASTDGIDKTIMWILEKFVQDLQQRYDDPIFSPISEKGSGIKDISEQHDQYLYGSL